VADVAADDAEEDAYAPVVAGGVLPEPQAAARGMTAVIPTTARSRRAFAM